MSTEVDRSLFLNSEADHAMITLAVDQIPVYLEENRSLAENVDKEIVDLWIATIGWVSQLHPDHQIHVITNPFFFQDYPIYQTEASDQMAHTLLATYGPDCTLPNKEEAKNMQQMGGTENKLHPLFSFLTPKQTQPDAIIDPNRHALGELFNNQSKSVLNVTSGIYAQGNFEISRLAKSQQYVGFPGTTLALILIRDWLTNNYGLMEAAHRLTASLRAGEGYYEDGFYLPNGKRTQETFLLNGFKQMGLNWAWAIAEKNGMYIREPVLETYLPRSIEESRILNTNMQMYLPDSIDPIVLDYLRALTTHQFGVPLDFKLVNGNNYDQQTLAEEIDPRKKPHIMLELRQYSDLAKIPENRILNLPDDLPRLEVENDMTIIKIPVNDSQTSAVLKALLERRYIVTGFEPASKCWYRDLKDGKPKHYISPPQIVLEKYIGTSDIIPLYLIDDIPEELREHYERIDRQIRGQI